LGNIHGFCFGKLADITLRFADLQQLFIHTTRDYGKMQPGLLQKILSSGRFGSQYNPKILANRRHVIFLTEIPSFDKVSVPLVQVN
jgi:alpha-D-ribose 1-methylphosphonate 5-phosphate C-P lyase